MSKDSIYTGMCGPYHIMHVKVDCIWSISMYAPMSRWFVCKHCLYLQVFPLDNPLPFSLKWGQPSLHPEHLALTSPWTCLLTTPHWHLLRGSTWPRWGEHKVYICMTISRISQENYISKVCTNQSQLFLFTIIPFSSLSTRPWWHSWKFWGV